MYEYKEYINILLILDTLLDANDFKYFQNIFGKSMKMFIFSYRLSEYDGCDFF